MGGRRPIVLDTCVLINFLAVDRMDLLAAHPRYEFLLTEHARAEVSGYYAEELARLKAALHSAVVKEIVVDAPEELEAFASLIEDRRLGAGECASIAAASLRRFDLATDDRLATRRARAFHPELRILTTADLMVTMIRAKLIDVDAADRIKLDWHLKHSFTLRIKTFRELL